MICGKPFFLSSCRSTGILPVGPGGHLPVVRWLEQTRRLFAPQAGCLCYSTIRIMSRKPLSFPKTRRLTLSSEFARVKGQGTAERGRFLVLGALKLKEEKSFRAGFVTPKHIGTAV